MLESRMGEPDLAGRPAIPPEHAARFLEARHRIGKDLAPGRGRQHGNSPSPSP